MSPEPRRRHRHFAEPNGHIPESNGDSGVNRIDVVQEDTIQIEGNLHIDKSCEFVKKKLGLVLAESGGNGSKMAYLGQKITFIVELK